MPEPFAVAPPVRLGAGMAEPAGLMLQTVGFIRIDGRPICALSPVFRHRFAAFAPLAHQTIGVTVQ